MLVEAESETQKFKLRARLERFEVFRLLAALLHPTKLAFKGVSPRGNNPRRIIIKRSILQKLKSRSSIVIVLFIYLFF